MYEIWSKKYKSKYAGFPPGDIRIATNIGELGFIIQRIILSASSKCAVLTLRRTWESIPGIGGITAAGILAELGNLRRFNRIDDLAAIVGLVPVFMKAAIIKYVWASQKEVTVI